MVELKKSKLRAFINRHQIIFGIGSYLVGVALTSIFTLYSWPYLEAKLENSLYDRLYSQTRLEREKNQLINTLLPQSQYTQNQALKIFDDRTSKNFVAELVVKVNLRGFGGIIKNKATNLPEIAPMPVFHDFFLDYTKYGGIYECNFITKILKMNGGLIFLRDGSVLGHEFTHQLGRVEIIPKNIDNLNERLTEYYSCLIFDETLYDAFAIYLNEADKLIENEYKLNYSPLAKCYFVDGSIKEFERRFDALFGSGEFRAICNNYDAKRFESLVRGYKQASK